MPRQLLAATGLLLGLAAAAHADTVVVTADRMIDVLAGRVVERPQVTMAEMNGETYLQRVSERSGLQVTMRHDETARLPLPQEREIWRIAKEAVTNVERHAQATKLSISWQCDGKRALLVVSDNGVGFSKGVPTRLDSYGIVGMRERAASIGAKLDVESAPGQGTSVRVLLEPV